MASRVAVPLGSCLFTTTKMVSNIDHPLLCAQSVDIGSLGYVRECYKLWMGQHSHALDPVDRSRALHCLLDVRRRIARFIDLQCYVCKKWRELDSIGIESRLQSEENGDSCNR